MGFLPEELDDFEEQRPAPKGRYPLRIVSAAMGETTDKTDQGGNPSRPMLRLGFRILNDEDNAYGLANLNLTFSEKGDRGHQLQVQTAVRLSHWFGVPFEVLGKDYPEEFSADDFVNAEADDIPVGVRTYDGRKFSDVNLPPIPEA